jgi:hypothetical protein
MPPLHPLLIDFLRHSERTGLKGLVSERLASVSDRPLNRQNMPNRDDEWFRRAINEIGPSLRKSFNAFLSETSSTLIRDYENESKTRNRGTDRHRNEISERGLREEGTHPISPLDNPEESAYRLVSSVEELIRGGYYDRIISSDHQICRFLSLLTEFPENLAQSLEFLTWIWEQYPKLDISGDIPSEKLSELAQSFCEAKGYSNAISFSKLVEKWLKGETSNSILSRLSNFILRNSPTNRGRHKLKESIFKRYQTVRMHAMFLFLSTGVSGCVKMS